MGNAARRYSRERQPWDKRLGKRDAVPRESPGVLEPGQPETLQALSSRGSPGRAVGLQADPGVQLPPVSVGVMAHIFNPSTCSISVLRWQRQVGLHEFKASLVYKASSKPARVMKLYCLKRKQKQNKQNKQNQKTKQQTKKSKSTKTLPG